jgi:hypothetical protein
MRECWSGVLLPCAHARDSAEESFRSVERKKLGRNGKGNGMSELNWERLSRPRESLWAEIEN